jgi:predicted membrane-bound spermidine synthase
MKTRQRYIYFAVFASGMVTLAVELAASRLLGNVFGTSNLVWASIIGLILIYLTAGYFIGGPWADKSPHPQTMYRVMLWGAFTIGVVPLISRPVLRFAADAFDQLQMGVLFGSFAAVLILFSIPVTLLGTISPFAIRLAIGSTEEAGKISGRIYAISTMGSFIGTFLPELLLIPLIGTTYTFIFFSLLLIVVALVGLGLSGGWKAAAVWVWMPVVLVILVWLFGGGGIKATAGQIFEDESTYNYIQVLQLDGYTYLRLNEGQGVHSTYNPQQLSFEGPWMQFLAGPFLNAFPYEPEDIRRIAIVGLAAGTIARQATAAFGDIPIDGYEIDPDIIEVGRKYFDMNMPNLNAIAQDGRWGLEHSPYQYDLVAIDAYRPPYIPWHLTTREFFEMVDAHLADDGVVAINVGRSSDDRSLIDALATTMGAVFPSIYVMDVPATFNTIVYATHQPTSFDDLSANYNLLLARTDVQPFLLEAILRTIAFRQPLPEPTIVLTDDRAPVEWIVNKMVLSYIISGRYQELQ